MKSRYNNIRIERLFERKFTWPRHSQKFYKEHFFNFKECTSIDQLFKILFYFVNYTKTVGVENYLFVRVYQWNIMLKINRFIFN